MKSKKIVDRLIKDVFNLNLSFKKGYLAIYDNLLKTPLYLNDNHDEISECVFEAYCEFLRFQLQVLGKE
jgi:hypothetical protein